MYYVKQTYWKYHFKKKPGHINHSKYLLIIMNLLHRDLSNCKKNNNNNADIIEFLKQTFFDKQTKDNSVLLKIKIST